MKLRYLLTSILAVITLAVGCNLEEAPTQLEELQVSQSYVGLEPTGKTSSTIDLTATTAWAFDEATVPSWLTISPMSGASDATVTFTATEATADRQAEIAIKVAEKIQYLIVRQAVGASEMVISTCKEVNEGEDGKIYWVQGVVTRIANTEYGNWYLQDATGEVYIYGTLDANGGTKNFLSLGIEVGDKVIVHGPRKNYNGTIELVDVTVDNIEKSLISVETSEFELEKEAGEFELKVTSKAGGLSVVPADGWMSIKSINVSGDNYTVVVTYTANDQISERKSTIQLSAGEALSQVSVKQAPRDITPEDIQDKTMEDFLALEVSDLYLYRLAGKVTKIANEKYGNIYVADGTDTVYVYGLSKASGEANTTFSELGIQVGDFVTFVGKRAAHNDAPQVGGAYCESVKSSTVATVKQVLDAASGDAYYKVTGTVNNIGSYKNGDVYGNFDLVDETGSIYVYGLVDAPLYVVKDGKVKFSNNKSFANLGIKEGDKITLIGKRGEYSGTAQITDAYIFATQADFDNAAEGGIEWTIGSAKQTWAAETDATYGDGFSATVDNIKVGYYKHNSTNAAIEAKEDHIRVYKGSALCITSINGKKIKKVVLTPTESKYCYDITVGGTKVAKGAEDITWTGSTDKFVAEMTEGQVRVKSIKIVME